MTALPIIAALAIGPALVLAERWLAGAARRNREAAAEDRLFRNGLRMTLRGSAALSVGAGLVGIWSSFPALPQPMPGRFADLPQSLAVIIAMLGGGQMALGLLIAHWRFRRHQYMDLNLSLTILLLLGTATALLMAMPFGIAWIATRVN